jgi:hypothetical protein
MSPATFCICREYEEGKEKVSVSAKEVDSSGGGASPSALAKVVGSRL